MFKYIMGVNRSRPYRRIVAPFLLALVLLFTVAPSVLAATHTRTLSLVGPRKYYLALGDSLAFGYQPDLNYDDGYVNYLYSNLRGYGVRELANMGCPGETSTTFINGGCPHPFLRKYPYIGAQLGAALLYLAFYAGQVSPVTVDIGANDVLPDINPATCTINTAKFATDLATVDNNLRQTILPLLHNALIVNGKLTGDLVLANYYDAFQNSCPDTLPYIQELNQHLANDASASGYARIADTFSAFGGATIPNKNICTYTWICSIGIFKDIHATDAGYSAIASAFERSTGY